MQATVTGAPTRKNSPNEILMPLAAACSTVMIPARLPKTMMFPEKLVRPARERGVVRGDPGIGRGELPRQPG